MSFSDFPNQKPVAELLQKSITGGRLAHAYLFTGGGGIEMEKVAGTLAKTLNCQNPVKHPATGLPIDSCDLCLTCRKIDAFNHPDIRWIRPESKLRVITIDQIREVIQTINLKPTEAAYKFTMIVAADRLNTHAANAFLKTLEEPPERSIIILTTENHERVLETILSRCLRLHFSSDPNLVLQPADLDWLHAFTETAAKPEKSLFGRYRLLSLLTLRLEKIKEETEKVLEEQSPANHYPDADPKMKERWEDEQKAAVEAEYRRRRGDLILLLQWWMRDIWLSTHSLGDSMFALPAFRNKTEKVAQRLSASQASDNLKGLERLQRQLHTNAQETLTLEIGLLKLNF